MKKLLPLLFICISLVTFYACKSAFISPQFSQKTQNHHRIAILPYQMVYTGRPVYGLTPKEKEQIQEAEALAFQNALYVRLLRQTGQRKRDIKIEIASPEISNHLLQDSGISLHDAWRIPSHDLCELLGVQAIIKVRVEKEKFLTDFESYGIHVATEILNKLPNNQNPGTNPIPANVNKTYRIKQDAQVLNADDATLLWHQELESQIDWNYSANRVIENMANRIAKKFPYRDRSYYR